MYCVHDDTDDELSVGAYVRSGDWVGYSVLVITGLPQLTDIDLSPASL